MRVRFGILSVGWWARDVHIPNLNLMENAEITALCSRNEENLKAGVQLCPKPPATYTDHHAMFAAPDVDAVIVCSPNSLHASVSVEALRSGKHVLCEKPMALTAADCDRVAHAVKATGKLFQVGLELRHSTFFTEAKKLIADGAIGRPRMAWCAHHRGPTSKNKWRGQKDLSGGPIFDVGVHYADLFHFLLQSRPATVSAAAVALDNDGIWDGCEALITLEDGTLCNYRQTLMSRFGLDTGMYVLGDKGYLHANLSARRIVVASTQDRDAQPLVLDLPNKGKVHGFDGSLQQLDAFVQAVQTGVPPSVGIEVGRLTTLLCLGIETSIAEKRTVQLSEIG